MTYARSRRWILGSLGFAIVFALWWIVADTAFATTGVVPSPPALVAQIVADGPEYYLAQIGVTLASAGQGYLWGVGLALIGSAVVLALPATRHAVAQLALVVECAPAVAVGPVVLALTGGRTPSIFLAGLAVFFTTLIATVLGGFASGPVERDALRVFGARGHQIFTKVTVVAALPAVVNALKIAVPGAILGAIIGEYLGGVDSGIGVALAAAQRYIQVERTWIFGLSAAAVTCIAYGLLALLQRYAFPWAREGSGR
ncbi:MAG: ABC transporter permease [Microbacterium sp.]